MCPNPFSNQFYNYNVVNLLSVCDVICHPQNHASHSVHITSYSNHTLEKQQCGEERKEGGKKHTKNKNSLYRQWLVGAGHA
jgi:hypothetical protein